MTKEVAAAARDGDPVAARLWVEAGHHLAATAAAAARQADSDGAGAVSWCGGLFAAGELLLEPFRAELARRARHLEPREPVGTALDGAELLARLDTLSAALGHDHRAGAA